MARKPACVALCSALFALVACGDPASTSPTSPSRTSSGTVSSAPATIAFTALSQGLPAHPSTCGGATFERNGTTIYWKHGCMVNGGRGFNVAAIDPSTGHLREPIHNFDTWLNGASAARAMVEFLDRQPPGTLLLIAVGDEAGMTVGATAGCPRIPSQGSVCCRPLGGDIESLRQSLESHGAQKIRQYCYWGSYSLIIIKGVGVQAEQLVQGGDAVTRYTLTIR